MFTKYVAHIPVFVMLLFFLSPFKLLDEIQVSKNILVLCLGESSHTGGKPNKACRKSGVFL